VKIRKATFDDIAGMLELDRESPAAGHWSAQQYRELIAGEQPVSRMAWVATAAKAELAGFLVAKHLVPEWELENIVVAPSARRTGVATRLLEALLSAARVTHSEAVFLEVRESNSAAQALYQKIGFRGAGRRKSYYSNPLEDAVLYTLALR